MIEPSEREVGTDCPDDEFEEANDLTHPGYVSHPRRSWPLLPPWTVRRRRGGASHRAWESQAALDVHLDPEQLWRVEFPARSAAERPVHWQERRDDDDQDEDDDAMITDGEQDEEEGGNARHISPRQRINDWEIRLLAAQMAEKGDGGISAEEEHDRRCLPIRVDEEDEEEEDVTEYEELKDKFKATHSEFRSSDSDLCQKTEQESSRKLSLREQKTETEDNTRLFGMLQQLSPTERRELERVLEVAAQRHLSQQLTFHSEGKDEDDESVVRPSPRRHHSLQGALPTSSPSISPPLTTESSTFLRRRGQNSRAARHSVSSPTQSSPLRVTDCGSELSSSLLASAVTTVASRLTETMPSPSHPPLLPPPPPRPPTPPSAYLRIPLGEDPDDSDQDVAGEQAADSDAGHRRPQSERCFFEDELQGEMGEQCRVSPLLSPAGTVDDDTVSICIPECEPLLGPK